MADNADYSDLEEEDEMDSGDESSDQEDHTNRSGSEDEGDDRSEKHADVDGWHSHLLKASGLHDAQRGGDVKSAEPPLKKMKLNKGDLYKAPTNEELSQLRETENLFHSSLFRLQITELLNEVMLNDQKKKTIDGYLHKLKDALMELPNGVRSELSKQEWLNTVNVKVPIRQEPADVKGKFGFYPPKSVRVVGSYLLGTCIKPHPHIDLLLEIPKSCLEAKDYLNQKYLRKRALYLAYLAAHLNDSDLVEDLHFQYHHGNLMRPVLIITPRAEHGKHFLVKLHVCPAEGYFKLNRFHVSKNNIRSRWYLGDQTGSQEENLASEPATPHYNMSVLQDLTMHSHLEYTLRRIGQSQGLREGIVLLKVWLRQRQLDQGSGGFSGFIMTMYVLHLLRRRKLNPLMSSYQIMRNTLLHLSETDWSDQGLSLTEEEAATTRPYLDDFKDAFEIVFVDPSGFVNLCASMNNAVYKIVQHDACLSLQCLDTNEIDSFHIMLMTPVPFVRKFDQTCRMLRISDLERSVTKLGLQTTALDHCGDYVTSSLPHLLKLLYKALGSRVKVIGIRQVPPRQWCVEDRPPNCDEIDPIYLGFLIDSEHAYNVLDRGPPADSSEAAVFHNFWGSKSELRRFQDGAVCEAVMWHSETIKDRRNILRQIVTHILHRHADIPMDCVSFVGQDMENLIGLSERIGDTIKTNAQYGTGEEQHVTILNSYNKLGKQLRGLKGLPLTITTVQGVSPVFRSTEVFPAKEFKADSCTKIKNGMRVPVAGRPCPLWTPSMKLLCTLEISGKWPEDKEAVRRIKAAYLIKLSQLLEQQCALTTSLHPTYVDIFKDGFVFRFQIAYAKEIALCKMVKSPEGMLKMVETEESLAMERDLVQLPKLTSILHGLQQEHLSFSATARLAKRWLSSQLLLDHYFHEEAVDLLVAYIFICPAPYTVPGSPLVGFLRFLNLLATYDWNISPLIINLNDQLTKEDITEIQNHFTKNRDTLPLIFLATSLDKFSSCWTKRRPTPQILQRTVLLAHESLRVLQDQLSPSPTVGDLKKLFKPDLDVFDVIIHLKTKQLSRRFQAVNPIYDSSKADISESEATSTNCMPVVDYDPVQMYITELREAFENIALFFHDIYGGCCIAVLWKPQALNKHPFKLSHVDCRKPELASDGKDVKLVLNIAAILEDFKALGEGLVSVIHAKHDKS